MTSLFFQSQPVAFDGIAGHYHAAHGNVAVLLVGSWGYEQYCLTKAWRIFGERLAAAGFPTLRYDSPGQGDSIDCDDVSLDTWRHSLDLAANHLERLSGARRLVVIGHGLGAALALDCLPKLKNIKGLVAMAPVTQGRLWLRELAAWSAMIGGASPGMLSVGGHVMPASLADSVRQLDIRASRPSLPFSLLVQRPDRPLDPVFSEGFAASIDYAGYELAVSDPTAAVPPLTTFDAIIASLTKAFHVEPGEPLPPPVLPPAVLTHGKYRQISLRFGAQERYFGVLTEPLGSRGRTAVLFVSAGRDPEIGWARIAVDHARRLATAGIASFRFDLSGNGETPITFEQNGRELLYSTDAQHDVTMAMDWLASHGYDHLVVVGRCSGAYTAFHSCVGEKRCAGLVMINPLRIIWNPAETVTDAIKSDARTAAQQAAGLTDGGKLRKFLKGEIDRRAALLKARSLILRKLPALPWSAAQRRLALGRRLFRTIGERGTKIIFVSSESDASGDRFTELFGRDGAGLSKVKGLSFVTLSGADHNLNQVEARDKVFEIIRTLAISCASTASSNA